jgi:MerR family transcriptional regulator, light-induced transcriptional regulator
MGVRGLRLRQDATSIYTTVRRAHPELPSFRLHKQTLLPMTRALEAVIAEESTQPLLFGSFQRAPFLEESRSRWEQLAANSRTTVVFTDEPCSSSARVHEVAIPNDSSMRFEWAVICLSSTFNTVLTAWEIPLETVPTDAKRLFEVVWSTQPGPTLTAALHCARLAQGAGFTSAHDLVGDASATEHHADDPDQLAFKAFAQILAAIDAKSTPPSGREDRLWVN